MNPATSKSSNNTADLLAKVADEFLKSVEAGQSPDVEQYTKRYPQIGAILRDVLPALTLMNPAVSNSDSPGLGNEPLIDRTLGDFRLIREIGRGGMGVVYEAEQISLGRTVALKVLPFAAMLDSRQLARFRNESRAAATLHHHNIVPVFSVGCERSVHFYAMQYIDGESLARIIEQLRRLEGISADEHEDDPSAHPARMAELSRALASGRLTGGASLAVSPLTDDWNSAQGQSGMTGENGNSLEKPWPSSALRAPDSPLSLPTHYPADTASEVQAFLSTARSTPGRVYFRTVAELGIQAADALDHAHGQGVIHRDIKPANLMLDETGRLWVTDFGLARMESDAGLTMTGDLLGTLRYMSPEQALAKRVVVDHRTDIYSLGVTLYELLALRPAFGGEDRQHLLKQIAFDEPPLLRKLNRQIPVELETIIEKAIRKNPEERYATAHDLADDLRSYLTNKPIKAKPPTWRERLVKWSRRHPAGMRAAVLAVVAILIAVAASVGWIARDRAVRQAILGQQVAQALRESKTLYQSGNSSEALSAAKRAQGILAGSSLDKLNEDVSQWTSDLETAERLDEIRIDQSLLPTALQVRNTAAAGNASEAQLKDSEMIRFNKEGADQAYQEVFRRYGLDLDSLDIAKAAACINRSPIKPSLAAALDDWFHVTQALHKGTQSGSSGRVELLDIARQADPDPWRDRLRNAIQSGDAITLIDLARDDKIIAQPVPTVLLLVRALEARSPDNVTLEGASVLRDVQRQHPADFWVNVELANCLPAYMNADEISFRRIAVALRPNSFEARLALADKLREQNRSEADALYREAILLNVGGARVYDAFGDFLGGQKRTAEAEAAYREAIRLKPNDYWVYNKLGWRLMDEGKYSEAETAFRECGRIDPNEGQSSRNLGRALFAQNKFAETEVAFREALQINPGALGRNSENNYDADFFAWILQSKARDTDPELETVLRDDIERDQNNSELHVFLASTLVNNAKATGDVPRWDEAAAEFVKAIDLAVDGPATFSLRKRVCRVLARWDELFDRVLKLRPEETVLWIGRGEYHALCSRWAEAAADYAKVIDSLPDGSWAPDEYACLLILKGDPAGYQQFCRDRIHIYRHAFDQYWPWLADSDDGWNAEGVRQWTAKQKVEAITTAWELCQLGMAYYRAGQYEQAIQPLEKSIAGRWGAEGLEKSSDWSLLAMAHYKLGHTDQAQECLKTARNLIEQATPKSDEPAMLNTIDWIPMNELLREAEALLQSNSANSKSQTSNPNPEIQNAESVVQQTEPRTPSVSPQEKQ